MTHALKTWPEIYKLVEDGLKSFQLRKADRPFKQGDDIVLQEWDNTKEEYTGKEWKGTISYVFSGETFEKFGLKKGYVLLGIQQKLDKINS